MFGFDMFPRRCTTLLHFIFVKRIATKLEHKAWGITTHRNSSVYLEFLARLVWQNIPLSDDAE